MRYVIYGAGAIGCTIGGRLFQAGHEVVLIARGAHLEAMQQNGLTLRTPDEELRLPVPAVSHPREITFRPDDAVILTMKTQDTSAALDDLEAAAGDVAVFCAQNGVENERIAARRFSRVYAMLVAMPATFLHPGEVDSEAAPVSGVLDAGVYPTGTDAFVEQVCAGIESARLSARASAGAMGLKHRKLLQNLTNGVQVATELPYGDPDLLAFSKRLREEGQAVYAAAGIDAVTEAEYAERVQSRYKVVGVPGRKRAGSSTWQSIARGKTTSEVDYLNGEIVLLGRLHGVPTPLNAAVRRAAVQVAASGSGPGGMTLADLERLAGERDAEPAR